MPTPVIRGQSLSLWYLLDGDDSQEVLNHNKVVIVRQLTRDWWSRWIPSTCETSKLAQRVFQKKDSNVELVRQLYKKLTKGFEGESRIEWIVRKLRGY